MAALYLQASGLAPRAGAGEETRPGADQRAARRHFGDENSGAVRRHTLFSQALFGNLKVEVLKREKQEAERKRVEEEAEKPETPIFFQGFQVGL